MDTQPVLQVSAIRFVLCMVFALLPFSAFGGILKEMDASALPGNMVELRLTFDGPAPSAKGYSIELPPRISIDLPYTRSNLPKYNDIGFENAKSVTVLEAGDRTRLVVNLREATKFNTRAEGNFLFVYIGKDKNNPAAQGPGVSNSGAPAVNGVEHGITHIDFQRGEEGEGNVIITLADKDIAMDMNEMAGRIQLEFKGDILPGRLRNRLDVIDFATPVRFIDANVHSGKTVITIEPEGEFEYLAYQTDNLLTISVKPRNRKPHGRGHRNLVYKGDKLSLNFQDIEVRAVLQLIADFTDLNLVASDTVGGNVTLRLQNVPWDQALDIVLRAKGLDKRLEGNVLTVAPADEIAARERQQLENEKQIRELAPVYTDLIQINYADAAEIAQVLAGDGNDESLLTERGSVQVVARTNSLLLKDTQSKLDEIRDLIAQLDIPVRQVMIEARIVTMSSEFSKELGVKWSGSKKFVEDTRAIGVGGDSFKAARDDSGVPNLSGNNDGVFSDLSVVNAARSAINIGFATNGTILNLELSALLSDGGGEVISQPKVITADKTKAVIKSGKEIPYQEKTSSGATSTSFKDAVLGLEVTPQITPDGRVIMDIKINNDESTATDATNIPIITTNEISTQVLVEDGETIVLGGVFKQNKQDQTLKVPLLGDIPLVGQLFRKETKKDTKEELLVFITPRIITDGIALK